MDSDTKLGTFQKIIAIFYNPTKTFKAIKEETTWKDIVLPILVIVLISSIVQFVVLLNENPQLKHKLDQRIGQYFDRFRNKGISPNIIHKSLGNFIAYFGAFTRVLVKYGFTIIFGILIGTILYWLGGRLFLFKNIEFMQICSLVCYINVITIISSLILLLVLKPDFQNFWASFFVEKEKVIPFTIIARLGPFTIWKVILFGLGLSVLHESKKSKSMKLVIGIWIVTTISLCYFNKTAYSSLKNQNARRNAHENMSEKKNKNNRFMLKLNENKDTIINFDINPMTELDFKSKNEIYKHRKKYVSQHSKLVQEGYEPSDEVFGKIKGGKPWWGIKGKYYYGHGKKSIKGPSEVTRWLNNPFLLLGLTEYRIFKNDDSSNIHSPFPPKLKKLKWKINESPSVIAEYNVSHFLAKADDYNYPKSESRKLYLNTCNARDFGYNYLYISPDKTKGISLQDRQKQVIPIVQKVEFIKNSGYTEGCNNTLNSPIYKVKLDSLPGEIHLKLWKKRPIHSSSSSDMDFTIKLK